MKRSALFARVEHFKLRAGPVINHQRPALVIDRLAVSKPAPEVAHPLFSWVNRLAIAVHGGAVFAIHLDGGGHVAAKAGPRLFRPTECRNHLPIFGALAPLNEALGRHQEVGDDLVV